MTDKPSINDYGPSDFASEEEYKVWKRRSVAALEQRVEGFDATWRDKYLDLLESTRPLQQQGAILVASLSGLRGGVHPNIARAIRDLDDVLASQEEAQPCNAVIHHGPGHQSKARCERVGPHTVHETRYGSDDQRARWKGDEVSSGFFNEPPDLASREEAEA